MIGLPTRLLSVYNLLTGALYLILCMQAAHATADSLANPTSPVIFPSNQQPERVLEVFGAADQAEISTLITTFQHHHPHVSLHYYEQNTRAMYQNFLDRQASPPDVVISSAMDLQVKLVNDGHAQPYRSPETDALPVWAQWRHEIFGFTYEPAVIVINSHLLNTAPAPESRSDLLDLLRSHKEQLTGKVGVFDIRRVGLGFLLWAHDMTQSGLSSRILEALSSNNARVFPSSRSMLKAIADGQLYIAYNVMGSYARTWAARHPNIRIIQPTDYTSVVMRSAFIPRYASNTDDARHFVRFLLSDEGQKTIANETGLYPLKTDIHPIPPEKNLRVSSISPLRPLAFGLPLLIYTDTMKRRQILEEWDLLMKESE